jgi:beta-lactamase regulating signal transducer with metallopeptidase domain
MQVWLQLGETFARVSVGAIMNSLWEAIALALIAWLVLRAVPRANASLRYGLWCVALLAVLILPVIALYAGSAPPAATAAPSADPAVLVPQRFAQFLFALWYVVATILVLRLIVSYIRLQQLKASAQPLPPLYQHRVRRWLAATGGKRECRLCMSDKVPMPVAIGLLDPVIIFPERLLEQLSDDELDQVGLHELSHLQRWDDYTNVFQKIAEALLFFNPAVYLIGRQLTLEREIACDDRVIAATGKPLTYAACLTRLVEATALTRQALPALAALSTRRQFAIRIERLLDKHRNVFPLASGLAAIAACLTMIGALAVASRLSPLVAVIPPPQGFVPTTTAAAAPVVRAPRTIAQIFILSRHAAADAAATAAVRPATFVRRIVTAVPRVVSVARSNAVGTRNFIVNRDTVEIIVVPASHSKQIALADMVKHLPTFGSLNVHFKTLTNEVFKLKVFVDAAHSHLMRAPLDGHVPAHDLGAVSAAYARDSARYATDSVAYANESVRYAKDSQPVAPAPAEDASASVSATDNVPVLAASLHALPPNSRVDVVDQLAAHLEDVQAREALIDAMLHDASVTVRLRAIEALAQDVGQLEEQEALIRGLRSSDSARVKIAIIGALEAATCDPAVLQGLVFAFGNGQPEAVQLAAVEALTSAADNADGQAALVAAFNSASSARVKTSIIKALMDNVREPVVRRALAAALRSDQPISVQLAAVEALAPAIDDPEVRAALEEAGGSGSDIVRSTIKRALAEFASP